MKIKTAAQRTNEPVVHHHLRRSIRAPPPAPLPTILCGGTLAQLGEFDLRDLQWLRAASPVLQSIKEQEEEEQEDSDDTVFWNLVSRAAYLPTMSLCTLRCKDAVRFQQTMDDWSIDLADAPSAFLDLVFSGEVNQAFENMAVDATEPAVRNSRHLLMNANARYAALMLTWGGKLSQAWLLRTVLVFAHPRFDTYVREHLTAKKLGYEALVYYAACVSLPNTDAVVHRHMFLFQLMNDAVGSNRLDWLQWLHGLIPAADFTVVTNENELDDAEVLWIDIMNLIDHAIVHEDVEETSNSASSVLTWLVAQHAPRHLRMYALGYLLTRAALLGSDSAVRLMNSQYDAYAGPVTATIKWDISDHAMFTYPTCALLRSGDLVRLDLLIRMGCPVQHSTAMAYAIASGSEAAVAYCRDNVVVDDNDNASPYHFINCSTAMNVIPSPDIELRSRVQQTKRAAQHIRRAMRQQMTPRYCDAAIFFCMLGSLRKAYVVDAMAAIYYTGAPWPMYHFVDNDNDDAATSYIHCDALKWMVEHGFHVSRKYEDFLQTRVGDKAFTKIFAMRNAIRLTEG